MAYRKADLLEGLLAGLPEKAVKARLKELEASAENI